MQISRARNRNREHSVLHLCDRIKEEKGQALVELALTLPALVLLLVAAAEFARVSYASIEVSNAAMAGVQYGAQSPIEAADTAGIQAAAGIGTADRDRFEILHLLRWERFDLPVNGLQSRGEH
jgi:Flp pilus assembly protein TadG